MEFESEQSDTKPVKTGKKTTTPRKRKTGSPPKAWQNKQTKTTKHTIEFSNNTPDLTAQQPRGEKPWTVMRADEDTHRSGLSSRMPSRSAAGPRRDDLD
jgi:hypothetical protein